MQPTELSLIILAVLSLGVVLYCVFKLRARTGIIRADDASYDPAPGQRYPHFWGYDDTRFEFCGPRLVRVTGNRYPLAGPPLPRFIPFVEEVLGVALDEGHLRPPAGKLTLPPAVKNTAFINALNSAFRPAQITSADEERLTHSHGQLSVDEIYRILNGKIPERVVDLVVYPGSESDVVELVRIATAHNVVLIPYGGGTNVSGALLCPPEEQRMIVSVDMQRMDKILEIDRANNRATVQAGITGKALEAQLEKAGYTCGHIPDSIELSTLGGWIATNASGMKKNRYGNIEDVVLEATLITPSGEVHCLPVNPRHSPGIQPRNFLFGSEGNLGIITRAVIQLRSIPQRRIFASYVFKDFSIGIQFLRQVQDSGARPASIRLTNNTEFRMGHALMPESTGWNRFVSKLKLAYIFRLKGFDPHQIVACTVVMEGNEIEVNQQSRTLAHLSRLARGLSGGASGGKRGYRMTFAIAYIRDFLNRMGILGETFETSAPWDRIEPITQAVERELKHLCAARGITGKPFLSYRVSQSYQTGGCIYFTMGFPGHGLDHPEDTYQEIEHRLREVILEEGGSLSHHHGVGKVRRSFVPRVYSGAAIGALHALKSSLDPSNVFGARNAVFGVDHPPPHDGTPHKATSVGEQRL